MERKQLEAIIGEQKLGSSGLVEDATAVKMGKLIGCRYMVTGKVTRFAYKKSGFGTGWASPPSSARSVPTRARPPTWPETSTSPRPPSPGAWTSGLIDVQTGEILAVAKEEGTTKDTSVKVAGTGNDVQYDEELVNKIFEPIADKLSETLIKRITVIQAQEDRSLLVHQAIQPC